VFEIDKASEASARTRASARHVMLKHRTVGRLALLLLMGALLAGFFAFGGLHYLSLEYVKAQQVAFADVRHAHPVLTSLFFFFVYVGVTALSVPGATVMTLAAGALFGTGWGVPLVSFASATGATLAFAVSRYVLRDSVRARFSGRLDAINAGVQREGWMYVLSLRLIPVMPFWLVNLLMGVTAIRPLTFYWASQLGMLPATLVYVNVGTQLSGLTSLRGVLSPAMLAALVALAVLPYGVKRTMGAIRLRRLLSPWKRPDRFDYNVVVIGAGAAGLVSSYIATTVRAKVALVEKGVMGGDCLNTGCVPSKALLRSAGVADELRRAAEFGIDINGEVTVDFRAVMQRVAKKQAEVAPHDSVERFTGLGVDCRSGHAKITSPFTVDVTGDDGTVQTLTTRSIVIAAGSKPLVPDIPGLLEIGFLTSDTVWALRELPKRLVVLGGGPIGCELAQGFARLGSKVIQIERDPRLLAKEDADVSAIVLQRFRTEGIEVHLGSEAVRCERRGSTKVIIIRSGGVEHAIAFDEILCAVGRRANTEGFGLEELGIGLTPARTIEVDDRLQTLYPNIYACGDVAGPFQFTHMAAHQAWYASVNAMFGQLYRFKVDYSVTPWVTFTSPEVARVGLNEEEAALKKVACEVTVYRLEDLDRAIADGSAEGYVKVLTPPGKDRILGATIVGEHAAAVLAEFVLAMRHGIGLSGILRTIHVYPTYSEAAKYAAGQWKLSHAPQRVLRLLTRYHSWMRGA
jgi:pyruvate/2-oxoglutarate dehydrogenase complex dihydrolipoamide dehydrogenase (E3) component/uncharacterized membrane protein YdjX (TVP38/TMEM64 family)